MRKIFSVPIFLTLFFWSLGAAGPVGGVNMPTLENERAVYRHFKKVWAISAEPRYAGAAGFTVSNPDIHEESEGDDLWTSLLMHLRTNQKGYLDRANGWAAYFKNGYRACVGTSPNYFCYDRDAFGACHLWGWGLVALFEYNGDAAALAEAESLGAVVERLWAPNSPFSCLPTSGCMHYGPRAAARHLHLAVRLAEATGKSRWLTLRDKILNMIMNSPEWNSTYGMYFEGAWATDSYLGAGHYAAGDRIQSSMQIGVLAEALWHAYRITGRQDVKNRLIAMAHYVDGYGLDSIYQYTASFIGIVGGKRYHSYSATLPATYWDPVYTTSLVNTLVFGYKLSGDTGLYNRAFYFFDRGNKGIYGQPVQRAAADSVIHHFVDSRLSGTFYNYNKGELQYAWALFEPNNMVSAGIRSTSDLRGAAVRVSPNPLVGGGIMTIRVDGLKRWPAELSLHDVTGRKVAYLGLLSGSGMVSWNTPVFSSGVYLLRARAGAAEVTKSVLLAQ